MSSELKLTWTWSMAEGCRLQYTWLWPRCWWVLIRWSRPAPRAWWARPRWPTARSDRLRCWPRTWTDRCRCGWCGSGSTHQSVCSQSTSRFLRLSPAGPACVSTSLWVPVYRWPRIARWPSHPRPLPAGTLGQAQTSEGCEPMGKKGKGNN